MFVVFEGIDGSGKTTLSNLVASKLRASGLTVEHVREGGNFASRVTQAMRELGRDARNLALVPRAELMLYLTREIQLFEEATRPALSRADIVIADRFVATAEALAVYGRSEPAGEVRALVAAATRGFVPDLTILVDVDPRIARSRRQVSKLIAGESKPPSRKGLAGPALQRRLRDGYRELAAHDPDHWLVIDNTEAELEVMANALVAVVRTARTENIVAARACLPPAGAPAATAEDVAGARAALLAWIDRRAVHEPGLAAFLLDGLYGEGFDERRRALAPRVPTVIAAGLKWLDDPISWQLRHELAPLAPGPIARSIVGQAAARDEAVTLLGELAASAPSEVGAALSGRDDADAWRLRDYLEGDGLAISLGGVGGDRAWAVRERWLAAEGGLDSITDPARAAIACRSVGSLADDRAWKIRRSLRELAPVAALSSVGGLVDDRAWRWRTRDLERAPKIVMRTIVGLDDDRAWTLRERVADRCEEVLDSIAGLDSARAWALREARLDRWAASAVKSLGLLATTERANAFITAALARHRSDLALWRQAVIRSR